MTERMRADSAGDPTKTLRACRSQGKGVKLNPAPGGTAAGDTGVPR